MNTKVLKGNMLTSSISTPLMKNINSRHSSKNLSEIGCRTSSTPFNKD